MYLPLYNYFKQRQFRQFFTWAQVYFILAKRLVSWGVSARRSYDSFYTKRLTPNTFNNKDSAIPSLDRAQLPWKQTFKPKFTILFLPAYLKGYWFTIALFFHHTHNDESMLIPLAAFSHMPTINESYILLISYLYYYDILHADMPKRKHTKVLRVMHLYVWGNIIRNERLILVYVWDYSSVNKKLILVYSRDYTIWIRGSLYCVWEIILSHRQRG